MELSLHNHTRSLKRSKSVAKKWELPFAEMALHTILSTSADAEKRLESNLTKKITKGDETTSIARGLYIYMGYYSTLRANNTKDLYG